MSTKTETPTPGVYIHLFNWHPPTGRKKNLGAIGPVFGPYACIHAHVSRVIYMGRNLEDKETADVLHLDDGYIFYAGQLYFDWSVFTGPLNKDQQKRLIPYEKRHSDLDILGLYEKP